MEDENKVKKIMKIIIILIIVIALIIAAIFIYRNYQINSNNNKLETYLQENNYIENEYGVLSKEETNENETITYKALYPNCIISKEISTTENNGQNKIKISMRYNNDNSISMDLQLDGYNKDNNYGILFQQAILINDEFTCEIVTGDNFTTKCDTMKTEAQEFYNEINQILENNNINPKYITIPEQYQELTRG